MKESSRVHLLIKYLTPTILSYLSVFLFTIVDGIFIGQGVGPNGLGAINIAFPFIMFFTASLMLATIGGLTITAIRFGRGDKEGANEVFMHSFVLALLISAFFTLLAVAVPGPICRLMGANETYLQMTIDYVFWYGVFMIPCGLLTLFNGFVRNDGRPVLVSVTVIITTTLNVIGDWLFIFPLDMGLKGAAIATGLSQAIGMLIVLSHFILRKGALNFHRFSVSKDLVKKIIFRGVPECVAQFCAPVTTVLTNLILVNMVDNDSVNAFSLICYVACFAIAFSGGVSEGMQPLFGKSYGAGNEKNLRFFKISGLIIGITGAAVLTVIVVLLTDVFCDLYAADAACRAVTVARMPVYASGFVIQAVTMIITSYLYSTTRTKYAVIINILRSFVVNSAVTVLVPLIFGAETIWMTFAIYEAIVAVVSIILVLTADRGGVIDMTAE